MRKRPLIYRFIEKIKKDKNGCWNWTAYRNRCGYGRIAEAPFRNREAHIVAYELFIGKVPKGLCVLHICDNPPCVNPEHLWLGTHAQNMADMKLKGRAVNRNSPEWYKKLLVSRVKIKRGKDGKYKR